MRALWALTALLIAAPLFAVTAVVTYVAAPLPATLPELPSLSDSRGSVVLAADGSTIATFEPEALQVILPASHIPDKVQRAVLAAEDHRFFQHGGLDFRALARAAKRNYDAGGYVQGGSTITQQLVKNTTGHDEETIGRKVSEALLAVRLERSVPKEAILARYLNTFDFGAGAIGIEAAARTYFGKPSADLTLAEAALLAGMLKSPHQYSPRRNHDASLARWNLVLDRLEQTGLATSAEVRAARSTPPQIVEPKRTPSAYPYFTDYVRHYLIEDLGLDAALIYGGGLTIQTTVDPKAQAAAEAAARAALPDATDPEVGVVSIEPATGAVRAMVGGRSHDVSQVNLATGRIGGGTGRQPGSSFKPFVLAQAFKTGMTPETRYDAPASIQPPGFTTPVGNASGRGYGKINLRAAMESSVNTVFVQLIVDVGVRETAQLARNMGVKSLDPTTAEGGIAIGTAETSPLEMADAYSTLARGGTTQGATPVWRVTAPDGEVLFDAASRASVRVLSTSVANDVTDVLSGVVTSGTGRDAALFMRPVAGKTGTTQNYQDAWFVGYTPQLATAVWVGFPQGQIPLHNIRGVANVGGGTFPARIFRDYMNAAHDGLPVLALGAQPSPSFQAPSTVTIGARDRRALIFPDIQPPVTAPPTTTTTQPPPTTTVPSTTTTVTPSTTQLSTTTTAPPATAPTTTASPSTVPGPPTTTRPAASEAGSDP